MEIEIVEIGDVKIAKLVSDDTVINTVQDAVDIMGNADCLGAGSIVIEEKHLDPLFFDLRTGIAGEILQKYSVYHIKLAIIGEFKKYNSNALKAFIIECNRGNSIFFVSDLDSAVENLIQQTDGET
ncbi:MAG: DUF4180 domain-containing protein [Chloroflexota bacterium]|nr:DUF4180 domain-containing protein [Chloroflexota bacterium]